MNLDKMLSAASRLFFFAAFVLFAAAVIERIVNVAGYTILRTFRSERTLEFAAIFLIFVIAMQLKEMKEELKRRS